MLVENTQEGGTDTTAVTTANSGGASGNAWTSITGTTVTYDGTAGQVHGTLGQKYAIGGALAAVYTGWDNTVITGGPYLTLYGRCYYWSSIHPGSSLRLIEFMNGATVLAYLGISNTVSKITFYNSANTAGSGFTLSTLIRIEFQITVGSTTTGSAIGRWFLGEDTTAQGADSTATAQNYGSLGCDTIRFGNTGANFTINSSFWAGDLQLNDSGFPGPQPAAAAAASGLRRFPLGV
jgi:hypothetical protein